MVDELEKKKKENVFGFEIGGIGERLYSSIQITTNTKFWLPKSDYVKNQRYTQ